MNNLKPKNENLDFSNKESQKLFEEFTLLLAEILEYVDSREEYIKKLENQKSLRTKDMVIEIFRRIYKKTKKILSNIVNK
jgi:hypothetical protein